MKKLLDSDRKIRLIELFGGIGTQAMALERMGKVIRTSILINGTRMTEVLCHEQLQKEKDPLP